MADYLGLKIDVNQIAAAAVPSVCYELLRDELNSRLSVTVMESEATITANAESEALPADFLEARHLYIDANPRCAIRVKPEFSANSRHDATGEPREAVIIDGNILFNPVPDGAYTIKLRYLAKLAALSADTDTTPVMDAHYGVYLYGTLKHYALLRDDDAALARWDRSFEMAIRAAEKSDTRKRYGASPLVMNPGAVA